MHATRPHSFVGPGRIRPEHVLSATGSTDGSPYLLHGIKTWDIASSCTSPDPHAEEVVAKAALQGCLLQLMHHHHARVSVSKE